MRGLLRTWLLPTLLLVSCGFGVQQTLDPRPAPLFEDLGGHGHPITTDVGLAQSYFDQGLVLCYAFNHAEAVRSFEAALTIDPECAMCFWGKALALGPNINKPMADDDVATAFEAVQQAQRFADATTKVEQALIGALAKRYASEPVEDRSELDRAYAEAMAEVAASFPEDGDVQTLYAEALMDTMPWNYWTEDLAPKPETEVVLAALESVMAAHPDHPGASHLYIHAVEASSTPERAEAAADRLGDLVPGSGHLVHMPSHIYLRLGRYQDASVANQRAAAADEAYIAACNAQGFYPALYYPHNIHFLWFTAALEGGSAMSIEAGEKVVENVSIEQVSAFPNLESFLPVPLYSLVRFGRWDEILERPEPQGDLMFLEAMSHYARGLARAAKGEITDARSELAAIEQLATSAELDELQVAQGATLVQIAQAVLRGEIAGAEGDGAGQIERLREAVELQDSLPYMEPPYWHYPVRHSLGAAQLAAGSLEDAEETYKVDLEKTPRNGYSLYGLRESLLAQGKQEEAEEVGVRFEEAWRFADFELSSSRY